MRGFLQFLGWASTTVCATMFSGAFLVPPASAQDVPPVSDCFAQCTCSQITLDCVSTQVTGCKTTCDCTGVGRDCAFE